MGLGSFDRAALIPLRSSFTSKVVVIASGITDRSLTVTGRGLSATVCSFTSGRHEHVNETRPTRPANKHSNTDAMIRLMHMWTISESTQFLRAKTIHSSPKQKHSASLIVPMKRDFLYLREGSDELFLYDGLKVGEVTKPLPQYEGPVVVA